MGLSVENVFQSWNIQTGPGNYLLKEKYIDVSNPPLYFNKTPVAVCSYQKHLDVFLDKKLDFQHHIKEKIAKASKGIGVIKKFNNVLPRNALLNIYKSFVRPHLDNGDITYHQPNNESINSKLESVEYNIALAITGAIKGTSFKMKTL